MTINTQVKNDEQFRKSMAAYIKEQFAGLLGEDIQLLDLPNGVNLIKEKYGIGESKNKVVA